MRAPSTFCFILALASLGCGGSQKWVSDVASPTTHSTDSAVNFAAEDRPDASEYRPWGAVRPRLAEVMTLGESDLPAVTPSENTGASAPAQPVVVNVNNHVATPAVTWPMYSPVWGVNSFHSPRCINCRGNNTNLGSNARTTAGQSRALSVPPAGSNWPTSTNQAPQAPSSPPQTAASEKPARTQAQRVGATTCASCITTGR